MAGHRQHGRGRGWQAGRVCMREAIGTWLHQHLGRGRLRLIDAGVDLHRSGAAGGTDVHPRRAAAEKCTRGVRGLKGLKGLRKGRHQCRHQDRAAGDPGGKAAHGVVDSHEGIITLHDGKLHREIAPAASRWRALRDADGLIDAYQIGCQKGLPQVNSM